MFIFNILFILLLFCLVPHQKWFETFSQVKPI